MKCTNHNFLRWDLLSFFKLAILQAFTLRHSVKFDAFECIFAWNHYDIRWVRGGQLRHRYLLHRFAPNVLCPNAFCEHSSSGSKKCLEEVFAGSLCTLCRHLANLQKKEISLKAKNSYIMKYLHYDFFEMRLVLFF